MKGKDYLTLSELTSEELTSVLRMSERFKRGRTSRFGRNMLGGKSIALVFEKPSTRTRVSFQVAISELGGNPINLSSNELQLGRGETIEDTGKVLSRYVHCIMARVNRHSDIVRLSAAATVPVINGLSELYHPVQVLADLLTLKEKKGRLKGLRVAWVGDGDNVCNSWALAAGLLGIHLAIASPKGFEPLPEIIAEARALAELSGGGVELTDDPDEAVSGADCLMTDIFVSMGLEPQKERREKAFLPKYQVDRSMMKKAKKDAIFMHCLPAHRGEEVTADVIDGPSSVVFDEAENRLHTTKGLLCFLLLPKKELP